MAVTPPPHPTPLPPPTSDQPPPARREDSDDVEVALFNARDLARVVLRMDGIGSGLRSLALLVEDKANRAVVAYRKLDRIGLLGAAALAIGGFILGAVLL